MNEIPQKLSDGLWRVYRRVERPLPWASGGNLPWDDPDFSARMLREHLDESHGAASRQPSEREAQIAWLWEKLGLQGNGRLLDITCGPGLYSVAFARRGCQVTGVDFGPASIAYARELAQEQGVNGRCTLIQQDVRQMNHDGANFDAALFLYGQLAVFTRDEARALLKQTVQALRPGGRLCVELLNQERVDKKESRWWYTDDTGLWGDAPYLHLGERLWYTEENLSLERFLILHLETGKLDEIQLCDQTYAVPEMVSLLQEAGFSHVDVYPAWDNLPLYDANEWVVYVAEK
ncbi:MAG: class I SAM-dependent methyltransferase [Ardenticatenaceae bacterium]|nr:class I SAM-dependent methyltransferase [Anaerolineales bacterium]MCB8921124.1 class I SAM-dependent methyltransferase [Ardenticatenaceae bacterium]MCB8990829.1 class I SAM-dependent methyltransferase [Ardenticatenaceae bacterium]MCB9004477.1 class I SAM-dependent methyltransferase [Ardenticatenaceae bacterium]